MCCTFFTRTPPPKVGLVWVFQSFVVVGVPSWVLLEPPPGPPGLANGLHFFFFFFNYSPGRKEKMSRFSSEGEESVWGVSVCGSALTRE